MDAENHEENSQGARDFSEMNFEEQGQRLILQRLAGGDIVSHPPVFAPNGDYLFILRDKTIQIYSTVTGELVRVLDGANAKLITAEVELNKDDTLVACSVEGEVLRWMWRTGELLRKNMLNLPSVKLLTFNQLNYYANSPTPVAFVTIKSPSSPVQWSLYDTTTGKKLFVTCSLVLKQREPLVVVGTKSFKYVVIAQAAYVYFLDYTTWQWTRLKNAHEVPVTVVRFHPVEELVATGDEQGKIFLWRQFGSQKTVITSLYHWHHTSVTSIAFSAAGTSFYSGGQEFVLVKWNVYHPEQRTFLPRLSSIIRQIAVNAENTQVAVCTADNGIQIVGNDDQLKTTLQDFTYITDDKTGKNQFPIGLRFNPRFNTFVLNGRVGHLQFYSPYTKSLLYNLDITMQNRLSTESGKILYDTQVTKAAFNVDWMATGEVFNDEEHMPELRLKFWKYQEQTQSYALNTNVELPHERGFKAIEFSSLNQVDNLLCATVGEDNTIKIWSLEESDNIYKKGKVWFCIAQTQYKNMPLESVSFSQDGSLLAAGYGNTLCVYKANDLKLKVALTSSAGVDGCVQKVRVRVAKRILNGEDLKLAEQRKASVQLFTKLLNSNDERLIKELQKSVQLNSKMQQQQPLDEPLDDKQKAHLYNQIIEMYELNLYQKVQLFQRLGIQCRVQPQWQERMAAYLRETVDQTSLTHRSEKLEAQVLRINERDRFKAKYRLQRFTTRKQIYDKEVAQHLVPIMSVLSLTDNTKQKPMVNGSPVKTKATSETLVPPPMPSIANISHVQFAAGDHAHLVAACTETRVLIWNLLTLRIQSVLKLSIKHLAFDQQTNLLAAFTRNNDLHVFQPNMPVPIYQRSNLPSLHGAIWLPRRQSKQRSLNVDWQSQSTLYFLTETQEILFLSSPDDLHSDDSAAITFVNPNATPSLRYSTFGTYAEKQISDKKTDLKQQSGPLIIGTLGKTAVKAFTQMSTHTMPPLSLLCRDFVKSLRTPALPPTTSTSSNPGKSRTIHSANETENDDDDDDEGDVLMNGYASDEDGALNSDQVQRNDTLKVRKTLLAKNEEISRSHATAAPTEVDVEKQLKRVAKQWVELEL